MIYKGFIIETEYSCGSDFTVLQSGEVRNRRPTSKDIGYYNIYDPMENMSRHGAEDSISACKERIDALLIRMNMSSNLPREWEKLV